MQTKFIGLIYASVDLKRSNNSNLISHNFQSFKQRGGDRKRLDEMYGLVQDSRPILDLKV